MQIRVPGVLLNSIYHHLSRDLHLSSTERQEPKAAVDVHVVNCHSLVRELLLCERVRCFWSFYLKYLYGDDCAGDCKRKMPRFAPEVNALHSASLSQEITWLTTQSGAGQEIP